MKVEPLTKREEILCGSAYEQGVDDGYNQAMMDLKEKFFNHVETMSKNIFEEVNKMEKSK